MANTSCKSFTIAKEIHEQSRIRSSYIADKHVLAFESLVADAYVETSNPQFFVNAIRPAKSLIGGQTANGVAFCATNVHRFS